MKSRQFIFFFTDSQTISKLAAGTDSPHYKQLQFKARGFIQALNHHKFRLYMLKCRFLVIRLCKVYIFTTRGQHFASRYVATVL